MCQMLHGHGLQPHSPRTGESSKKESVAAEERVLDAGNGGDAELNRLLVHAHMAGVDAQGVTRLEIVGDDLAAELNPRLALSCQTLHAEAGPAKQTGAQPLLETDRELHAGGCTHEPMAVHQVSGC